MPEQVVTAAPGAIVEAALSGWGTASSTFDRDVRAAYITALTDPVHVHAVCEEYRAAAGLDREHDAADQAAGHRIGCPLLVLWAEGGPVDTWYASAGGPLGVWRSWAGDVRGSSVTGGHFFPEEQPGPTAATLRQFFGK